MAQYKLKLNKKAIYYANGNWITDSYMLINRHLLNTNSELLNSKLNTTERFKYTISNGIEDTTTPNIQQIVDSVINTINYDNELTILNLEAKLDRIQTVALYNRTKNYFTWVDITYLELFQKSSEYKVTFYSLGSLSSVVAVANNDIIGIVMPINNRRYVLPAELCIVKADDLKELNTKLKTIIL